MSRGKKIKKTLEKYGADSLEKLMALADDEQTQPKLKIEIYRWFAEMEFGKPVGKSNSEPEGDVVVLDGELDKWSE